MNLVEELFKKSKNLNKFLVLDTSEEIKYNEAYSKICLVSGLIKSYGYKKGDKILLYSDNSVFFIISHFAIILSGCVSVPMETKVSKSYLDYIINACGIKFAFVQERYQKKLNGHGLKHLITDKNIYSAGASKIENTQSKDIDPEADLATILFTSGSTGIPKGVMLSHYNVMYNTSSILEYLKLTKDDIIEVVLPFYYSYGLSLLNTHVKVGGSLALNNKFMFPGTVLDDINRYRCTGFAGVPSTFQILLRKTRIQEVELPTLRYVTQAGGRLAVTYIKELMKALPNTSIYIMYGQTEATARLSYLPPDLLRDKIGSIGKGIPGTRLEVLDENGCPIKPEEIGEIVASGGNIMKGYFNDDGEAKEVLRGGKLYTGDLATIDGDGFIYIVDREKNIIKSGGHRISPREIEDVIVSLPDVAEAAVIPVEDEVLGEAVKAFIVLKKPNINIDTEYIKKICRAKLVSYKSPKYIEVIDSIPRNSYGKVLFDKLRMWGGVSRADK